LDIYWARDNNFERGPIMAPINQVWYNVLEKLPQ
jgi:hypothetical protein